MSDETRVDDLLQRWEQLRANGQTLSAEELCAGCPDLLDDVRRHLRALDLMDRALDLGAAGLPPTLPHPDRPAEPATATPVEVRYRPLHLHARGGLGEVFLARDEELRRDVALKRIQASHAGHPSSQRRFLLEAVVTGRLEHPGVVPVYGLGQDAEGRLVYAMRFVRGDTLEEAIRRFHAADKPGRDLGERALALRQLLGRFQAVCNTIGFAHSRGLLHRDLKPANIMLGDYGETLVMDWGLAKEVGTGAEGLEPPATVSLSNRATLTGDVVGTPAYMSPEQASGAGEIGPASDVHGLGATLYALLTGQPPFSGGHIEEVVNRARHGSFPPPRQVKKEVPRPLEAICLKAMALRPEDRYATALDLAADVDNWLAGEPVSIYRDPLLVRISRWARKNRTKVTAALAALLVALAGLAVGLVLVGGLNRRLAESNAKLAAALAQVEKERNSAVAVSEFLRTDLLGQADIRNQLDPGEKAERNPNITVAELLDRAAWAIEGKFPDQPETEAAIRLTIGAAYRGVSKYERAQPHLERSLAVRMEILGDDHPDTLTSKNALALLHYDQGKYGRAEQMFLEVLGQRARTLGDDHPDTLTSKNDLAALYVEQRKDGRAEALFLEVLGQRARTLGDDHQDTLSSKNDLAVLYFSQDKYDKAEALFLEVVRRRARKLSADHPDTLNSKSGLAAVYHAQRKFDRAEPLCLEVLEHREKKLGADHPDTLSSKNTLAALYADQGKYDKAKPLYLEVVRRLEKKLGAGHPYTLTTKSNLAVMYTEQGKDDRAEPLYLEVLEQREKEPGADHPDTFVARYNLGALYHRQKKYAMAEPLFQQALSGATRKLGLDHPHTQLFHLNLTHLYDEWGKYEKAQPLLRQMESFLARAGPESPATASARADLGLNLLRLKKYPEAEKLLRDSLRVRAKTQPDDWTTFNTRSMLGEAFAGQKKYADAEPLLVQGQEGLEKRAAEIPPRQRVARLREALERLVQMYDATGNKDEAAKWRKKLDGVKK